MKPYKHNKYSHYALAHIKANNIRCRYYGWYAMCGDVDIIKIDGRFRRFHVETHKELLRAEALVS